MRKLLLLFLVLPLQGLLAQNYNFGKVSKEELLEQFNPVDSSAAAAFLYKYRKTYFQYTEYNGFQVVTEVHERIKIYKKEGFDYATKKINLYKDASAKEEVRVSKAYTYNLVNDKIEETKLKSDGEFDLELSKYYNQKSFTMPNIKEGSVIEYRYELRSPFIAIIDEFKFQHDIPIKKLVAIFEVPEYFNYKVNVKGFLYVKAKEESSNDEITVSSKSGRAGVGSSNTSRVSFFKTKYTYDLTDVPALKNEPYVNNIENYRSSAKYELSYTKFPNSLIKYYSTTWEDVIKTIYQNDAFGSELNKKGYFNKDLDALLSGVSDPIAKIQKIFSFVKSKVKWNGYYGKYTDKGVKQAYANGTGNIAEINLMLTAMLRSVGLDANPVLVSTRDNGIPLFPTREGYNYVIAGVEIGTETLLLDASSVYSKPNILPVRALNWEGKMIKKDGSFKTVELYAKEKAFENIILDVSIMQDGNLEGKMRTQKRGHKAMSFREGYDVDNKDTYIEKLENNQGDIEISDFEVLNFNDLSKDVLESYVFIKEEGLDMIGNRMYVSPLFFLATTESPFKLEKREFPIDFRYPSESRYLIGITIPEGYVVESLPEPSIVALPDTLGSFSFKISSAGNRIQLFVNTSIEEAVVAAVYYESLREYFKLMINKMNEKIVLTKI